LFIDFFSQKRLEENQNSQGNVLYSSFEKRKLNMIIKLLKKWKEIIGICFSSIVKNQNFNCFLLID